MEHIKAQAWEFRVRYNLGDFMLNIEELNKKDIGFKIVPYSEAQQYLKCVGLIAYSQNHKGFATSHEGKRLIFYSDALAFADRNIVIAHEIGHIVLGHTTQNSVLGNQNNQMSHKNQQEQEADIFALAFLAPVPVLLEMHVHTISAISQITGLPADLSNLILMDIAQKEAYKPTVVEKKLVFIYKKCIDEYSKYENQHRVSLPSIYKSAKEHVQKRFVIKVFVCILSFLAIAFIFNGVSKKQVSEIPASAPIIKFPYPIDNKLMNTKETTNATSLIVCTTTSGQKYHTKDCHHIKNKDNLTEFTVTQAKDRGFTPCKDCTPDSQ